MTAHPIRARCTLAVVVVGVACLAAGCGTGRTAHHTRIPTPARSGQPPAVARPAVRPHQPSLRVHATQTRWRLPAPVYRTVAVVSGRRIFVLGGHDAAGGTVSQVDALDLDTGAARVAGTLAVPTHGAAAVTLDGRALVFGGASSTVHDLVQQFSSGRRVARVVGRLPGPRADVTATVVGHEVLLIGGFDGIGPQRDVWAGGDGRRFHVIARLPVAVRYAAVVPDGGHAYARIDGRVLVLGGSTPRGPSAQILRFDSARGRVTVAGRLPHPVTDAAVASVGNHAYLLGGISSRPLDGVIQIGFAPARAGPRPMSARASPHTRAPCSLRPVPVRRSTLPSRAVGLVMGHGSLWAVGSGRVSRVDPANGRVLATIPTPESGDLSAIASGPHSIWVTATATGDLYRINPRTDRVIATVRLGHPVRGVVVGPHRVWVTWAAQGPGRLVAINLRDDRPAGLPIPVGGGPGQVVVGQRALWVQNTSPWSVLRVDPRHRRVRTVIDTAPPPSGPPGPGAIAVGFGSLWSEANGWLRRLDPGSAQVRSAVRVPRGFAIALGSGRVWVLAAPRSSSPAIFDPIPGTAALWQIDPRDGRTLGGPRGLPGRQPIAIAATATALWIADYDTSTITQFRLAGCDIPGLTPRAAGERSRPRRRARMIHVTAGPTVSRFTMSEPAGAIRVLRLTAPGGTRARLTGVIPRVASIGLSVTPSNLPSEACRRQGSVDVCTEPVEACPMPAATWRFQLQKLAGPAGEVKLTFVVG